MANLYNVRPPFTLAGVLESAMLRPPRLDINGLWWELEAARPFRSRRATKARCLEREPSKSSESPHNLRNGDSNQCSFPRLLAAAKAKSRKTCMRAS